MMANKGTELGKCFVTTSLYVRTLDKRTLFLSETYNYEKMAGEEFIISVTPCADESTSLGKVHRLVLVAGEGEHVPVFRSRVHYVIQSSRIEFSGDRHPPSQIGHTTYRGQAVHVAKVQSGFFAPRASFRFGDLKDELSKMGLELQERKIRPEKQDRLPVHSAIVSEAAAAPEQREVSKKKKKRADSSSKRAELGETSSRAQEHKNVPFVYVCTYLMGLLKKKFLITPSSVDPGSFGWTLLAEGSKATESKLLELYPEIKEFAIANPDYQLTLMTTLRTELGKCFVTTSLYVRTLDKRTLFLSETYNYEKMAGEEFIISVTPCADESTSLGKVHRLVLVAGEGEHVPVFRSRVHYVIQSSRIEFSGDRHPPSQIGHTTYRGQAVHVAKVQSGFFAPRASFRFGDLKDELSKMGLELQERKIRPEKQDRLPVHSAIVSEAAAAPEQREVSKKKKKRADSSSKRAELGETSSRAQEHKNVPFVYVCTYLMGLLKKKFLITPSSVDPGSFGWTLLAEGSKATESKLLELYPEIKEFAIANPDYQLTLMTTLQCLKQLAQQYQLRLVVAQFLQDQPTLWSVFVFQFSEIRNSQHVREVSL
ncbi:hypothetical protein ACJJTC_003789 [Scirpophaga incertulas]